MDRVEALTHVEVDAICLDTAHGHSKGVIDALKKVKENFPDLQVVGGNVATGAGALALAEAGADQATSNVKQRVYGLGETGAE